MPKQLTRREFLSVTRAIPSGNPIIRTYERKEKIASSDDIVRAFMYMPEHYKWFLNQGIVVQSDGYVTLAPYCHYDGPIQFGHWIIIDDADRIFSISPMCFATTFKEATNGFSK